MSYLVTQCYKTTVETTENLLEFRMAVLSLQ